MSSQSIQERYGAPPPLETLQGKKAKLCEKCKEHGQTVYFFWGGTGVMKKNDPTKEIVLPVEITTGKWHECPFREDYNPQGSGNNFTPSSSTTTTTTTQRTNDSIGFGSGMDIRNLLSQYIDQNKQMIQYQQTIVASLNHAVEYLETIANSLKSGPRPIEITGVNSGEFAREPQGSVTGSVFDTEQRSSSPTIDLTRDDEDARVEKEYKEYKEKYG